MPAPVSYGAAVSSGAVLALAFPEPDVAPLAWVALAPLLFLLERSRSSRGFGLGYAFGFGFFGVLIVWISIVGWVAWLLVVLLESLFIGAFGAVYAGVAPRLPWPSRPFVAAAAWVGVAEYLRGIAPLGGFTWGQLAQSQHDVAWLLKAAGLGGGWTIALVLLVGNGFLAQAAGLWSRTLRNSAIAALSAAAVVALPALLPARPAAPRNTRVAIVQGNVPRDFGGSHAARELAITLSHSRLTEELAGRDIDLVVWPESAVGLDIDANPAVRHAVTAAARAVGAPMVVGGNVDKGDRYAVMAFAISPDGSIVDRYQKTHLVPFGEYVPARGLLGWIPMLEQVPRDAIAGRNPKVLDIPGLAGKVAPVISFEGDFPSLVRARIAGGGRLLVVATNTSTWGRSWASAQHVAMSEIRAAENGVWVVHAAISGISAFIDPTGRVVASIPLWTRSFLVEDVAFADGVTLYARTGDWLPLACLTATVVLLVASRMRRQREGSFA